MRVNRLACCRCDRLVISSPSWHGMAWPRGLATLNEVRLLQSRETYGWLQHAEIRCPNCLQKMSTYFRITRTCRLKASSGLWYKPAKCSAGPVRSSHGQWYITKFQHLPGERDRALEIRYNAVEESNPSVTLNMGITCPEYCPQLST